MDSIDILLVEDDANDVLLVEKMLSQLTKQKFSLHTATYAGEAVAFLDKMIPDLLLLDLGLPDSTGLESFAIMRAACSSVPIVILSGKSDDEMALQAVRQGAQDYLIKGVFSKESLLRVIRYAIERQSMFAELNCYHAQTKASEQRFRSIIEKNADGMLIFDHSGKIEFANMTAADILGCSILHLIGSMFEYPFDAKISEFIIKTSEQEKTVEMRATELEWCQKTCLLASLRDISERKKAERREKLTARVLELLNHNSPCDATIGKIVHLIQKFTGIESVLIHMKQNEDCPIFMPQCLANSFKSDKRIPTNLLQSNEYGSIWVDNSEDFSCLLKNCLAASVQNSCLQEGDESIAWIPLRDGNETIGLLQLNDKRKQAFSPKLIAFFEGIAASIGTAAARSEAECAVKKSNRNLLLALERLKKAQNQNIQQERMHALGEMASGIAHDFNNALTSITGFTELLVNFPEKLDNRKKALGYLESILTASKDAAAVVNRLREFYRPRQKNEPLLPVKLNDIITQVIEITCPKWKNQAQAKGIKIHIKTHLEKISKIQGIESELREMLTNLIFNATDAMPNGGTITIATYPAGENNILRVSDTGVGMDEMTRQLCMEPFYTTKGKEGTGLGLASVYGVVKRHGGTIKIASQPSKGAIFTISLPISDIKCAKQSEFRQSSTPKLRILIVDDDQSICMLLEDFLALKGHNVHTTHSPYQALEKITRERFDMLITDRAMPEMNGDKLAKAVKKIVPSLSIIMLTGFGNMMQAKGEKPDWVDLVLAKPFSLEKIQNAIIQLNQGMRKSLS